MNNWHPFTGITEKFRTKIIYYPTNENTSPQEIKQQQHELSQLDPDSICITDTTGFISGKPHNQDELTTMRNNEHHQINSTTD